MGLVTDSLMKNKAKHFVVPEDQKVKLDKWPTEIEPFYASKEDYEKLLGEQIEAMNLLQSLLYAHNRYSLLLIFQAMDAAGKDSAIKHVMSGVNPQGCQVFSFKQPSSQEQAHDFLWRAARCLPERGKIGIFNRSYYEEVLIVRVHPELLQAQPLPDELRNDKRIWEGRYRSIVDFEDHLYRNGTRVVKFFLHLSKAEQKKRFLARLDEPDKNWKFSSADIAERKRWGDYMEAYEQSLTLTSTDRSPWYVVPADDKKNARLIISQAIVEALSDLKMEYPKLSSKQKEEFAKIRKELGG